MTQTVHQFRKKTSRSIKFNYLLSLPDDYNRSKQRRPLMLFLHGAGERTDHPDGLNGVKVHGPPKRWDQSNPSPFVVVSPQCPADTWWPEHVDSLLGLLDEIEANYRIDSKRIYLTGLSMGGFGAWTLAALHPERFAAAVPICGGLPWHIDLGRAAERMKSLPLWVFHGALDDIVLPEDSQRVVDALKAAGAKVKFTLYPKADHDSWTKTYANPKLYEWLLQHTRP